MPSPYIITRGNLQHVREQMSLYLNEIDARVDQIVTFLKLETNAIGFDIVASFEVANQFRIGANSDVLIDITSANSLGINPPTLAGDIITIHSPGIYEASLLVGMDTGSASNVVACDIWIDGAPFTGIPAGVEQAGGQGSIAVQSNAHTVFNAIDGTTVEFRASATDALANIRTLISGGLVTQLEYDWDLINP
jgi:hypothetical protein